MEAWRCHSQGQTACHIAESADGWAFLTLEPAHSTPFLASPARCSPHDSYSYHELWIRLDTQRLYIHSSNIPLIISCLFLFLHSSIQPPTHPPTYASIHKESHARQGEAESKVRSSWSIGLACFCLPQFLICEMGIITATMIASWLGSCEG